MVTQKKHTRSETSWFRDAKWGVFTHYLTEADTSAEEWSDRVDRFDVARIAEQLRYVGAGYYFITIGQGSGHYCCPNTAYDSFVGITPSKCSKRDLVSDLYDALEPEGIKLMMYLPSDGSWGDAIASKRLGWKWGFKKDLPLGTSGTERTGERLAEFQLKWEAIVREWSTRWGSKVSGWWVDGCYFADEMYRFADSPNFESFASAMKAGNPDSIVAFNPGVLTPVISHTEYEDYTAGEIADAFPVCPGMNIDGAQYHILSYLGDSWCSGEPRFSDEFVVGYTKDVVSKGGVMTWDVPITHDGQIPQPFIDQLALLRGL